MHIVLVHRSGSGQFHHLIGRLLAGGADVTLITERPERQQPGLRQIAYAVGDSATQSATLAATEYHLRTGEAVADELGRLRRTDMPDLVIGHIGWGGMLFAKDALPGVPALGYCEYYYNGSGSDLDFDPTQAIDETELRRVRMRNAAQLLTLQSLDGGYTPTRWQQAQYPGGIRNRLTICHDGIDTRRCRPDPHAQLALPDGRVLRAGDPVVTFAARDLDPYRGYPQFMRMARRVARERPDAVFVTVGGDGPGYGRPRPDRRTWREVMTEEAALGDRLIHLPWLPHETLLRLFQVSAAHVYLTVPFVLSWSLLEAMACGCVIVGSATAPVMEVVTDGRNGLLAPFFDEDALAERVLLALHAPDALAGLRAGARASILRGYELDACLDRQMAMIEKLIPLDAPYADAYAAFA